jgi:hypothetical protein
MKERERERERNEQHGFPNAKRRNNYAKNGHAMCQESHFLGGFSSRRAGQVILISIQIFKHKNSNPTITGFALFCADSTAP